MRERRDFGRYAMLPQGARDLLFPHGGPNQPFVESIGLSQLEADSIDGIAKVSGRGIGAESMQDALLMRREIVR